MTSTPSANDDTPVADRDPATDDHPALSPDDVLAVVEEYDDAPDECTIYPDGANRSLLTEWISAEGDAFVALDAMR